MSGESSELYVHLDELVHERHEDSNERFALDVLMGLTSKPKTISPKYLYDEEGYRPVPNPMVPVFPR